MASRWFKSTAAAAVLLSAAALSGCSGSSSTSPSNATESRPAGQPVTIEFWGAAIGQEKAVDVFNAAHTDVQIKYTQISAGSAGGYSKMLNAVNAGNAPCLGQISYDTVPSFAASGSLEDITDYAKDSKDQYSPAAWQLSSLGGHVFGIPTDLGPMALFYRTDLFEKYGIAVPTTWDEFASAAKTLQAKDPAAYLATFPLNTYDVGALSWQAGGQWFGTENDAWKVSINDDASKKVANYWQGLVKDKLVVAEPAFDTAWYTSLQSGRILSYVGAAWSGALLEKNAPGLKGKIAVAEVPQWNKGEHASGNRGGGAYSVLKGCKNPKEATEAAVWLTSNADSVTTLVKNTGLYPASVSGQKLPAVTAGSDFFVNGSKTAEIFTTAANNTPDKWVWGPNMTSLQPKMNDGLKLVGAGQGTVPDLLKSVQDSTVADLKSQGLSVKE
ncbi:sugar ABC transporter substrate-binding protein [Arthrobacter sp. StoSoilA2]|uniref:ABC transporter substrate-binding protein n=1 Tax=Arthrobacter sp. StoSoilA2 TaxID=2830990 RepID=UPI001CC777AE|nr:sugar ABC transporter substrate-binding protein [Arthrobacter sp. StoSoilA2]BCW36028.1 sugar ABC transporter substrate-binding protein [Arthrobacter sp. StoSoilA2]